MTTGTVKFFKEDSGFGFIEREEGKDLFVHVSDIAEGGTLNAGDNVEFEIGEGKKGEIAQNVRVVN